MMETSKQHHNDPLECIGLLYAVWISNGKITSHKRGTAFAISNNIIITCLHNFFDEQSQSFATKVIFIPNANGIIKKSTKKYESVSGRYYQADLPKQPLSMRPLVQQVAIIKLSEKLDIKTFLKVDNLKLEQIQNPNTIGYPSANAKSCSLNNSRAIRRTLQGNLQRLCDKIIYYNLPTEKGFSGSPIFVQVGGQTIAIGIHTHKSTQKDINCGIFFSNIIISKIIQFMRDSGKKPDEIPIKQKELFKQQSDSSYIMNSEDQRQKSELESILDENKQTKNYTISNSQSQKVKMCDKSSNEYEASQMSSFTLQIYQNDLLNESISQIGVLSERHQSQQTSQCSTISEIDLDEYSQQNESTFTIQTNQSFFSYQRYMQIHLQSQLYFVKPNIDDFECNYFKGRKNISQNQMI